MPQRENRNFQSSTDCTTIPIKFKHWLNMITLLSISTNKNGMRGDNIADIISKIWSKGLEKHFISSGEGVPQGWMEERKGLVELENLTPACLNISKTKT